MKKLNREKLTPMMQQYLAVKDENPDAILFFRLGDFYEMFFDDALLASRELEITLTKRDAGLEEKAPMCGVPYHVASSYISKLINKGYKVAICDQMEDPKLAKGIVTSAKVKSGTMLTVNEAINLSKDVWCFPYPFESEEGKGCNKLVQEGAFLLYDTKQLFDFVS